MHPIRPKPFAIFAFILVSFFALIALKMLYSSYTIYLEQQLADHKRNIKFPVHHEPENYIALHQKKINNFGSSAKNRLITSAIADQMPKLKFGIPQLKNPNPKPSNPRFIPNRRIVHLDLKGAPPKIHYLQEFFKFIKKLGATGILIEWEDAFPYTGVLADAKNGNAYTEAEVITLFQWARENELEVIPLVQTFGHLEWILKHKKFAHLREVERYAQTICLTNLEAIELIKNIIDQVLSFHEQHENGTFFHMGADEAFQVGLCKNCTKIMKESIFKSTDHLMINHIKTLAQYVRLKYNRRVLVWHDMLDHVSLPHLNQTQIGQYVEPVVWCYAEQVTNYLKPDLWNKFAHVFPFVWAASAFKGADGPDRYHSNVQHYAKNHLTWIQAMTQRRDQFQEFRGIILTGWQRFDHFAVLCELLPVGIPSLALNLQILQNGVLSQTLINETGRVLGCKDFSYFATDAVASACQFPGYRAYQLIQQLRSVEQKAKETIFDDNTVKGWLSEFNYRHNYSSAWYLDKILFNVEFILQSYQQLSTNIRSELRQIFHDDTVDEFVITYIDNRVEKLIPIHGRAIDLAKLKVFPVRPFPIKFNQQLRDNQLKTDNVTKMNL